MLAVSGKRHDPVRNMQGQRNMPDMSQQGTHLHSGLRRSRYRKICGMLRLRRNREMLAMQRGRGGKMPQSLLRRRKMRILPRGLSESSVIRTAAGSGMTELQIKNRDTSQAVGYPCSVDDAYPFRCRIGFWRTVIFLFPLNSSGIAMSTSSRIPASRTVWEVTVKLTLFFPAP